MKKKYYNGFDNNYRESLLNRIKVNKNGALNNTDILKFYNLSYINNKTDTSKDNLYYSMEKNIKMQKAPFNRNNISILNKEKTKNTMKLAKHDTFKKTINIYTSENQKKEGNIIEDLQNNKYLRPMLDTSNINIKLLKCQIEEPIKNISNFSLKKYINKYGIFSKNPNSPNNEKHELQKEDKINTSNINNRSVLEKLDSNYNLNSGSSFNNKMSMFSENNNNSFVKNRYSYQINKYMLNQSPTNLKKYSSIQVGLYNENNKKKEKNKERNKLNINKNQKDINIMYKTNNFIEKSPINNKFKKKNYNNESNIVKNKFLENKNNLKNGKLLEIYKKKLIEEFIIVLNKLISKHLNKNIEFFFKNIEKFQERKKEKEKDKENSKTKVYLKKNNKCIKKKLTLTKNNEIKNKNLIFNYELEKEKDIEKIKTKVITTDTSNNNFNLNNKSFSNEIKSSSLSFNYISNLLSNNTKQNHNNSSSFLFIDKKHKNYSQSPEENINKYTKNPIKTKIIIYKNKKSETPGRSPSEGKGDNFIYKKKNLKNDNLNVNKNNNKYIDVLKNRKKEKIIGIDINLGKPIRIINDHSPLEELYLEENKPYLSQLNEFNYNKFYKNKKRKTNSGTKKKIKPPLQLKKFAEEIDNENEDFINNFYLDSFKQTYTLKRNKEKNIYLENTSKEMNSKKLNKSIMNTNIDNMENIMQEKNLYIRTATLFFYDYKNKNNYKNNNKSYNIDKNISLGLLNEKTKDKGEGKNQNILKTKKVNKLFVNCTKFFVKLLIRLIKKRFFNKIYKWHKRFINK